MASANFPAGAQQQAAETWPRWRHPDTLLPIHRRDTSLESIQHGYAGPERRVHRTYVTRNTEYHFRGQLCVAVRDRKSGTWLSGHLALNRVLSGGVRIAGNGAAVPLGSDPEPGDALFFGVGGRELITSALCAVERPDKRTVSSYPGPRRSRTTVRTR
jgi:hypothetical protein